MVESATRDIVDVAMQSEETHSFFESAWKVRIFEGRLFDVSYWIILHFLIQTLVMAFIIDAVIRVRTQNEKKVDMELTRYALDRYIAYAEYLLHCTAPTKTDHWVGS
jgi:hypothetical protein